MAKLQIAIAANKSVLERFNVSPSDEQKLLKRLIDTYRKNKWDGRENVQAMEGKAGGAIRRVEENVEAKLLELGVSKARDASGTRDIDEAFYALKKAAIQSLSL